MLGLLPFASRRNLFGLWNQILPELEIGLLSILTFFSSWKSDWSWGAAARFSRMRPRRAFRSAGARGSAFNAGCASTSIMSANGNADIRCKAFPGNAVASDTDALQFEARFDS